MNNIIDDILTDNTINEDERSDLLKSAIDKMIESVGAMDSIAAWLFLGAMNVQKIADYAKELHERLEQFPELHNLPLSVVLDNYPELFAIPGHFGIKEGDIPIFNPEAYDGLSTLPATALTNLLKQFLNSPTRINSPRLNRITVEEHYLTKDTLITYKGEGSEYLIEVERVKELFAKRVQNGAKIFNFLLQKLNEQNYAENTEFMLSELVEAGIYKSIDSAYRGLKGVLDKLMHIHVEGTVTVYEGRKKREIFSTKAAVVASWTVSYKRCIAVLPQIIRNSAPYITILPTWGYALQNESAYILLDYIYYLARQNTSKIKERGYFTIGFSTIRQHIGLPSPDEVKDGQGRSYNRLIIKPIEDAITAIGEGQRGNDLKLTPKYARGRKNIHEFLDGYLEVELSGKSLVYMEERAIKKQEKSGILPRT